MECSICLENIEDENKYVTQCAHIFHNECINKWTENHNSCPTCRTNLDNKPSQQTQESRPPDPQPDPQPDPLPIFQLTERRFMSESNNLYVSLLWFITRLNERLSFIGDEKLHIITIFKNRGRDTINMFYSVAEEILTDMKALLNKLNEDKLNLKLILLKIEERININYFN